MANAVDLQLEKVPQSHPRRLVKLGGYVLAFGGDNGIISAVPVSTISTISSGKANSHKPSPRVIQRYDEPIRAIAISKDGLRIAIGFQDGSIDVYYYTQDQLDQCEELEHPFISKPKGDRSTSSSTQESSSSSPEEDDPFADDDFFTQSDDMDDMLSSSSSTKFRLGYKFESIVRDMEFDPRSHSTCYYLAIATDTSPGFVICNATNETTSKELKYRYLGEDATDAYHEGGVRGLAYAPSGETVSTLGMDGRLCVWNVKSFDEPEVEWELLHRDTHKVVSKPDVGEWNGSDVADRSLYPSWSPDGRYLAIPGENFLQFRRLRSDNDDWSKQECMALKMGETIGEIVSLAHDPKNEGYVVTSGRDGKICLWQITKGETMKEDETHETPEGRFLTELTSDESMCTHILWENTGSSKEESLHLVLENGSMKTISGRDTIIPPEIIKRATKEDSSSLDLLESDDELETQPGLETQPDLETQPTSDSKQSKKKKGRLQKHSETTQDDDDDDLIFDDPDVPTEKSLILDEADEKEEDKNDDDDLLNPASSSHEIVEHNEDNFGDAFPENEIVETGDEYPSPRGYEMTRPAPQAPLAPSSTPLGEKRRILCWNQIGVITSREGSSLNTIDISFSDSASHRPVTFKDNLDFILGTIGNEGALFASDVMDDDGEVDDTIKDALDGLNGMSDATKDVVKRSERRKKEGSALGRPTGSNIYFHRFETFGPVREKDWSLTLPDGERVLGCASGEGWNAVVTSRRFLRTFTSGGLQGPIIWMKGDLVTMVGRDRFLAVIYHESEPFVDGTQKLGYALYDGVTGAEICSGSLSAISPRSSLNWAGFTNNNCLTIMDESGMLSMLVAMKAQSLPGNNSAFRWAWIPVLDTVGLKKSREDVFWPIHVQDGKLICVPLKGVQYPDAARRPLTSSLQLRMPLARGDGGRSVAIEEVSIRSILTLQQKSFLNNFITTNHSSLESDHLEAEYASMSAQVDKVTLKLFISMAEAGKVERALDLSRRLHLEQSFDIAMTVADQTNLRKLSDKIFTIKEERFNNDLSDEEEEEELATEFDAEYESDYEPSPQGQRKVTPDISKKAVDRRAADKDSDANTPSKMQKISRRQNPFAKKRKESPTKTTPVVESSPSKKPMLSRMSTFSAQSRQQSKFSKQIM